ncbi:MAG: site-specific integrase [Leptolyngbya sp. SIO1D8]|nr:site-specific integrase [Leptolyngbya sp. SIO1D8]
MPDTLLNRQAAERTAADITVDIAYGRFDPTLAKYLALSEPESETPSTVQLFEQFMQTCQQEGTSGQAMTSRYQPLLSNLKRFDQNIESVNTARAFIDVLRARQSPRIANQSLGTLKAFGRWAVEQEVMTLNPFEAIKPLKGANTTRRDSFTLEEVHKLMEAIAEHEASCYYYNYCVVLFSLGLRISEAIGLRWKHVDLDRGIVTISESLSRSEDGRSAGYARQRKTTKTGSIRSLPISSGLLKIFKARWTPKSKPDDLVFPSPTGKPIDDRSFRQRIWKRACERAGIRYLPPYCTGHTFITHGLERQNWTYAQAAKMAGHKNTRMVIDVYSHMIDTPELPDFDL